jgi:hypothetical protein
VSTIDLYMHMYITSHYIRDIAGSYAEMRPNARYLNKPYILPSSCFQSTSHHIVPANYNARSMKFCRHSSIPHTIHL